MPAKCSFLIISTKFNSEGVGGNLCYRLNNIDIVHTNSLFVFKLIDFYRKIAVMGTQTLSTNEKHEQVTKISALSCLFSYVLFISYAISFQMIELLSYALVLSGNHIFTSGCMILFFFHTHLFIIFLCVRHVDLYCVCFLSSCSLTCLARWGSHQFCRHSRYDTALSTISFSLC